MKAQQNEVEQERIFKDSLTAINCVLANINKRSPHWGMRAKKGAQKVIDGFNDQSMESSTSSAQGLYEIVNLLGAHLDDLDELCKTIATNQRVPLPVVRSIVDHLLERNLCTGDLLETIIPILPEHMRPE